MWLMCVNVQEKMKKLNDLCYVLNANTLFFLILLSELLQLRKNKKK